MQHLFSIGLFIGSLGFTIYGYLTLDLHGINERPGPGYFPLIIGIALIIATGINTKNDLMQYLEKRKLNQDVVDKKTSNNEIFYPLDTLILAALIAVFILILNSAGAIISMVAFVFGYLWFFNPNQIKKNIIYSIVFPALVYLLFDVWLQTGLPNGLLSYFYE